MKDKMYYFLLGFMSMAVVVMASMSYNQTPNVDTVCSKCGSHVKYINKRSCSNENRN